MFSRICHERVYSLNDISNIMDSDYIMDSAYDYANRLPLPLRVDGVIKECSAYGTCLVSASSLCASGCLRHIYTRKRAVGVP